MDNTWIGIMIGGGSLLTSVAAFGVNAYFRARSEEREDKKADKERREADWDETAKRFNLMCHNNQGRMLTEVREADRRIHARVDHVEHNVSEKILVLSNDLAEIKGAIKAVQNSVNGGLEERIKRAVRSALDE